MFITKSENMITILLSLQQTFFEQCSSPLSQQIYELIPKSNLTREMWRCQCSWPYKWRNITFRRTRGWHIWTWHGNSSWCFCFLTWVSYLNLRKNCLFPGSKFSGKTLLSMLLTWSYQARLKSHVLHEELGKKWLRLLLHSLWAAYGITRNLELNL